MLRDIRPQRYLFDTQSPTHSHEIIATILGPDSSSHCGAGLNTPSLIRWLLDGEGSASVRQLSEFVLGRSNWDILCCVLGAYRLESLTTALRINILWNEECKSEVNRMVRNYSMARALIVLDDLLKPSNLEKLRAKKEYMVGLFLSLLAAYVVVVTGVGIDVSPPQEYSSRSLTLTASRRENVITQFYRTTGGGDRASSMVLCHIHRNKHFAH